MRSTTLAKPGTVVLLASPDSVLTLALLRILNAIGLRVETAIDGESAVAAFGTVQAAGIVLLDVRLPEVANGRLLATMHEYGMHKRCAIALIAEQVSDE
jgi:DNA-binding NtrC family response regulator